MEHEARSSSGGDDCQGVPFVATAARRNRGVARRKRGYQILLGNSGVPDHALVVNGVNISDSNMWRTKRVSRVEIAHEVAHSIWQTLFEGRSESF